MRNSSLRQQRAFEEMLMRVSDVGGVAFFFLLICSIASKHSESSLVAVAHPYFTVLMYIVGAVVMLVPVIFIWRLTSPRISRQYRTIYPTKNRRYHK